MKFIEELSRRKKVTEPTEKKENAPKPAAGQTSYSSNEGSGSGGAKAGLSLAALLALACIPFLSTKKSNVKK